MRYRWPGPGRHRVAAAINEAQDKGTWVCLQNCHPILMPTLERLRGVITGPDQRVVPVVVDVETVAALPGLHPAERHQEMTISQGRASQFNRSHEGRDRGVHRRIERSGEQEAALWPVLLPRFSKRTAEVRPGLNMNMCFRARSQDFHGPAPHLLREPRERRGRPVRVKAPTGECNRRARTDDMIGRCLRTCSRTPADVIVQPDDTGFPWVLITPPEGPLGSCAGRQQPTVHEGPELFGLHDNANITCALGETNLLLNTVLSLQPRSGGGGGMSWDDQLAEVSADIEGRLPPAYDIELALIQFPVRYDEAMNTVLTQELQRFNNLTDLIKGMLKEVQRAIKGLVVMSGELETMGNSMVTGKVPEHGPKAASPPESR